MVFPEVRPACLYSSGISYAMVKSVFLTKFAPRESTDRIVQTFSRAFPNREGICQVQPFLCARAAMSTTIPQRLLPRLRFWNFNNQINQREVYIYQEYAPAALFRIPVLALAHTFPHLPQHRPRVAPPSNPLLQLSFCGTRLRSTGQFRLRLPSLPDRFCACGGVWPVRRETTRGEI